MSIEARLKDDGSKSYRVRVPDYSTGKRRNVTIGTFRTKREAEKAEREALSKRDRGHFVDPARITVGEVVDTWLESRKPNLTDNSYAAYEGGARLHIRPALGHIPVQRLQYAHIQQQVNAWGNQGMGARLIHRNLSVLKQALHQAVKARIVHSNPAEGLEKPSVIKKRTLQVWDAAQVVAFLDASLSDQFTPLWHFLVLEGMRRGEALGLRWSDINWQGSVVTAHVQQTVVPDVQNRGKAVIQQRTKTASGSRTVHLTATTIEALRAHQDRVRFAALAAGEKRDDQGLIFTTSVGTLINPTSIKRNQARIMKAAGVPTLTTHDLRHTAATRMLLQGVPVVIVSQKLGHKDISVTLSLYAHVLPADQQQANDAMEAMLAFGRTKLS